ncbi:MAG: phosphodiester glycosidase family protein [Clostridia bacterium]|nr:phosphodiester glycosidase family protein [Clostridia bacterium]
MVKYLWKIAVIAVLLALLLVLVPSPVSNYDAFAEVIELGLTDVGLPVNWANYTSDTHYEDPSLTVDIYTGGRIYDTNYMYAIVKIANGTQIRTAVAGDRISGTYKAIGSTIASAKNAVFAVNGDYFKEYSHGYLVRQGTRYRNSPRKKWDMLIIDQYGDLHVLLEPTDEKVQAWIDEHPDLTIVNSFNFGPAMLVDGEQTRETFNNVKINLNTDDIGTYKQAQRMCICQLAPLTYLFVTSEGPEDKNSVGLTMDQFLDCIREIDAGLEEYDVQIAYNLDGGSSSTMVFKAPGENALKKINAPTNPKVRYLCDIIYFASAWQPEQ